MVRLAAIALVLLTLILTAVVTGDARGLIGRATPGFPVFVHGIVSVPVLAPAGAAAAVRRLRPHDRVIAIDGAPVAGGRDVWAAAARAGAGTPLRYTFARPFGGTFDLVLPPVVFTEEDFARLPLPFLVVGILLLAVGTVPILVRPDLTTSRLAFVFLLGVAMEFFLLTLDWLVGYRFSAWLRLAGLLAMAALLHLGLVFPERRWPFARPARWPLVALYGAAIACWALHALAMRWAPPWTLPLDVLELGGFAAGFVVLTANLVRTARRSPDAVRRQQARVVLPAPVLVAGGMATLLAASWELLPVRLPPAMYLLPVTLVGLSLAYATLKHNVFELDAIVRRVLTLAIVAVAPVAIFVTLFSLALRWLGTDAAWASTAAALPLLLVLVPAGALLRSRVERAVEATFFPRRLASRVLVHAASRQLPRVRDGAALTRVLRDTIAQSLEGVTVRVLAGRPDEPLRELEPVAGDALVLPPADPVYVALRRGLAVWPASGGATAGRTASRAAMHRAAELGVTLAIPLPRSDRLVGGLLLGPQRDGRLYTTDDVMLLETLAGQAAVGLGNVRAWEEVQALQRRLTAENVYLRDEARATPDGGELVGRSAAIRTVLDQVRRVAPTDAAVLVQGETGTGKELIVRTLHAQSRRAERVLVKVACAALPEPLLESELFGHEPGAFTGAVGRKVGRLEIADGGTLFFDDVDTLPAGVQAKLLRALQEGEVQRLGSNTVRRVDVRVLAATNRDLLAEVAAGRFREDLYYRLNVVPIRLPALRERREDIPVLVEHLVRQEAARLRRSVEAIGADALAALEAWHWPGNVRELRNVVQRALVLCEGPVLRLPDGAVPAVSGARPDAPGAEDLGRASLPELLQRYKVALITRALEQAGGNQRAAAALLGIHRPSLTRMLRDVEPRGAAPRPPAMPGRPA